MILFLLNKKIISHQPNIREVTYLKEAVTYGSPIHCVQCGNESVDVFDIYDRPIGYISMIRNFNVQEVLKFLEENERCLAYMKCTKCNRTYMIDWSKQIPRPLLCSSIATYRFRKGGKSK